VSSHPLFTDRFNFKLLSFPKPKKKKKKGQNQKAKKKSKTFENQERIKNLENEQKSQTSKKKNSRQTSVASSHRFLREKRTRSSCSSETICLGKKKTQDSHVEDSHVACIRTPLSCGAKISREEWNVCALESTQKPDFCLNRRIFSKPENVF
jgi:hypothetical protein